MIRRLVIVAREHPELHEYLRHRFAQAVGVEVILDRRGDGAVPWRLAGRERPRSERRSRPQVDELLRARSHVIVTIP